MHNLLISSRITGRLERGQLANRYIISNAFLLSMYKIKNPQNSFLDYLIYSVDDKGALNEFGAKEEM